MANPNRELFRAEIDVPKGLQELHGERTRISTLVLVYLSGLICAGVVAWQLALAGSTPWRVVLAALIFMDVGGGVVANFSDSTNRYYRQHANLRLPFIALHVFHPAVLALLFPAALPYFVYVILFTLAATFTVNAVREYELQQNLAALLVAAGCLFSFCFPLAIPVLYAFAPLFMVKLTLGFAVRRSSSTL